MCQGNEYTDKSDVYSWGIILWEVFSRQQPFNELNHRFDIINSVGMGNRPMLTEEHSEPIRNLITACWDQNASNRPTMNHVVKQMVKLCKSFPDGDVPLAITDSFVDRREINTLTVSI